MPNRDIGTTLQMGDAANVGTQNGGGLQVIEMRQFAITQGISCISLQN
jgi:hypothetical protein